MTKLALFISKPVGLLLAALLTLPLATQAATISITPFDPGAYTAAVQGGVVEDFESSPTGVWDPNIGTSVGTFSPVGGVGTGAVCRK
jgi:hypothetical protein